LELSAFEVLLFKLPNTLSMRLIASNALSRYRKGITMPLGQANFFKIGKVSFSLSSAASPRQLPAKWGPPLFFGNNGGRHQKLQRTETKY